MTDIPSMVHYKINFCIYVSDDVKTYEEYKEELTTGMKEDEFSEESINLCLKYNDCDECPYCSYDEYMIDDEEFYECYCYLPKQIEVEDEKNI